MLYDLFGLNFVNVFVYDKIGDVKDNNVLRLWYRQILLKLMWHDFANDCLLGEYGKSR